MIFVYIALYFVGLVLLAYGLTACFAMNAESSDDPEYCKGKALEFLTDAHNSGKDDK